MFILKINLLYFKAVFLLSVNIVSNENIFTPEYYEYVNSQACKKMD